MFMQNVSFLGLAMMSGCTVSLSLRAAYQIGSRGLLGFTPFGRMFFV